MIGWFIVPYARRTMGATIARYCKVNDFNAQIVAAGGAWSESEVLGDCAIVKVRATQAGIDQLDAQPGFIRIPVERLDDPLSTLSAAKKLQIRTKLETMGYSLAEIQDALGVDLGTKTLRQLLIFMTTRRIRPRFDGPLDSYVFDGPIETCKSVDQLDTEVSNAV
jgi:hypothetical protein